jgi:hypothetical protein
MDAEVAVLGVAAPPHDPPPPEETKKCNYCKKTLPVDAFDTRVINGEEIPLGRCAPCVVKNTAVQDRYKKSAKGKARDDRYKTSDAGRASEKRYAQSEKRRAVSKRYDQSEKGRAAEKRFKASDAGRATAARYRKGEAGQATLQRQLMTRRKRRKLDPAYALMNAIACSASHLLSGERQTSPTFVERTGFESEAHFVHHMRKNLPSGVSMEDYGEKWEVEHAIPQEAYDFSDPEDMKRCWSPDNVRGLKREDNMAKGVLVLDDLCRRIGPEFYPADWEGKVPSEEEKEAFYARCKAAWEAPEAGEDSEDNDSEEDNSEDEDDSDECSEDDDEP